MDECELTRRANVGRRRRLLGARLVLVALLVACSGTPDPGPGPVRPERRVVVAVQEPPDEVQTWPWLDSRLPRRVPASISGLTRLADDPPGRATVVYHPAERVPEPVDGWASETLLLHGIDGRWRVLPMDELGLDDAIWPGHDTYGAGSLSPDGRWWAGRSRAGVVLLDLGTGRGEIVGARRWVSEVQWRDDSRSLVVALGDRPRTELLDLSGRRSTLSFRSGEASAADDGRWWSGRATDDGRWESIEWLDGTPMSHGAVELPELRRSQSEQQLVGVEVAGGRGLLTLQRSPYRTLDLVVVGVSTPELLAHLHLNARNRRAFRDGEWLDPETVLLQWGPGLVAWRPLEGTFARVMDVDLPRGGFASLDVATDLAR